MELIENATVQCIGESSEYPAELTLGIGRGHAGLMIVE